MAHTYSSCIYHCIFSTRERTRIIRPEFRDRLWAYIGGIARTNDFRALAVGGTDDHAHAALSIKPVMPIAKAVQLIKGGSSLWVNESFGQFGRFEWQEGYAAFSVSRSAVADVIKYVNNQEERHRTCSFEDEFRAFLRVHDIEFDERYMFG